MIINSSILDVPIICFDTVRVKKNLKKDALFSVVNNFSEWMKLRKLCC